jgi:hypothetical protein
MYSDSYDYQRDITEGILMQFIDWEQEQADIQSYKEEMAMANQSDIEHALQESESAAWADSRIREMEDLRLAADLRNLAERIERRYK